jgi:hypothetical protein
MRALALLTLSACALAGFAAAWAAGPTAAPTEPIMAAGGSPPSTEQLGQVIGSFTFPDPPIPPTPPYHNVVGLAHDGDGHLYCGDFTVPQFFLIDPLEPTAQLIDGPYDAQAHSATPVGITTDGTHVYIGDTTGDDIDVYELDGNYLRSFSVAAQTGFAEGIAFNRITGHLYVVDGQGGLEVHEFTLDGTFVQTFAIVPTSPDGLAFDHQRCSYWLYDGGPSGTDTVRHLDLGFVEMESFPGPLAAGYGYGDGVAVIGDRLYITTMVGSAATVVIFDVADAMSTAGCDIFEDGFENGDFSAWSSVVP